MNLVFLRECSGTQIVYTLPDLINVEAIAEVFDTYKSQYIGQEQEYTLEVIPPQLVIKMK